MKAEHIDAAAKFHRDHPDAALSLVEAINALSVASTELQQSSMRLATHFDAITERVSEFERRLAALEGVAGLGDLR